MASKHFTVHFVDGLSQTITADSHRESGSWITFVDRGSDATVLSAEHVSYISAESSPRQEIATGLSSALRYALLPLAALGAWLGIEEAFLRPNPLASQLFGAALLAVAVGCAIGFITLAWPSSSGVPNMAMPMTAYLGTAMAGVLLSVVQLSARRYFLLILWGGLALLGGAGTAFLWRKGFTPSVPKAVTGFLSATVLVAFVQFWYSNEYLPANLEPALSVTTDMAKDPSPTTLKGMTTIAATIKMKNVGKSKIRLIMSYYRLVGIKSVQVKDSVPDGFQSALSAADADRRAATRFSKEEVVDLIAARPGDIFGAWLNPGEEDIHQVVFFVPTDQYNTTRLTVEASVGNAQRLRIAGEGKVVASAPHSRFWEIDEPSLISRFTRGRRFVRTDFDPGPVRLDLTNTQSNPLAYPDEAHACVTTKLGGHCAHELDPAYGGLLNIGSRSELSI